MEGTECVSRFPGGGVRRSDLFGFCDLLAVPILEEHRSRPWIYLQVTSWGHVTTRLKKIQNETTGKGQWTTPCATLARAVLNHGDRIIVEGWKQEKPYAPWEDRELEVEMEHLNE